MPAALGVTLVLSGSTLAAPMGQITEFSTATANAGPEGMVAGPDGNLWYAEINANKIARGKPRHWRQHGVHPSDSRQRPVGRCSRA